MKVHRITALAPLTGRTSAITRPCVNGSVAPAPLKNRVGGHAVGKASRRPTKHISPLD